MKQFFLRVFPLLLIIAFAFVISLQNKPVEKDDNCTISLQEVKKVIPDTANIKKISKECIYKITYKNSSKSGFLLYADPSKENIAGFGGKMRVFVTVDENRHIKGVFQGTNNETPGYLELLQQNDFYKSWNGLTISKALQTEVDALTGATISSNAIKEMVKLNLNIYNGIDYQPTEKTALIKIYDIPLLIFFLLSIIFFFLPDKTGKIRIIILAASVSVPGIIYGSFASMEIFNKWFITGLFPGAYPIFIIVILSILITIFKKQNIYCYYYCPMGSLQEILYKTPSPKLKCNPKILKFICFLRTFLLFMILTFMIFRITDDFSIFEPFSSFRIKAAAVSSIVLMIAAAALSIFFPRPWCKICPTGEVFDRIKKVRSINKTDSKPE
jgi:NosR/NirI family transcriptional regulator, nitrous oxide reductase regulator